MQARDLRSQHISQPSVPELQRTERRTTPAIASSCHCVASRNWNGDGRALVGPAELAITLAAGRDSLHRHFDS